MSARPCMRLPAWLLTAEQGVVREAAQGGAFVHPIRRRVHAVRSCGGHVGQRALRAWQRGHAQSKPYCSRQRAWRSARSRCSGKYAVVSSSPAGSACSARKAMRALPPGYGAAPGAAAPLGPAPAPPATGPAGRHDAEAAALVGRQRRARLRRAQACRARPRGRGVRSGRAG